MRTLQSCKIANWFAFYQLGFLTLYSLIWIICFRNLLGHNRIIAINTLPRVNNGNLYFISLVTIRFWGGFWGRGTQWRSCVKDLFNKGNSAGWQLIYFSQTLNENYFYFHAYQQHGPNKRYLFKTLYCETHKTMNCFKPENYFMKIMLLCCEKKANKAEKTKPQTEMVISLWFRSLLAHPKINCDW